MGRRLVFAGAAGAAVALAAFVFLPAAGAEPRSQVGERFEYGELSIFFNDAVFTLSDRSVFLEGPERIEPERIIGKGNIKIALPPRLIHLHALGREGWELTFPSINRDGAESFTLKRRY